MIWIFDTAEWFRDTLIITVFLVLKETALKMDHKIGWKVLVTITLQMYMNIIKVHLLVFNTFYAQEKHYQHN